MRQQERYLDEHQGGGSLTLRYTPTVSFLHNLEIEGGATVETQQNHHKRWFDDARVRTALVFDRRFDLNVHGGYVQAVIEPTSWLKITPPYRIDEVDGHYQDMANGRTYRANDYGTINQPKLSAVVTPSKGLGLYANYGRTFRIGLGVGSYIVPSQVSNLSALISEG